jgi:hypothetical protein
MYFTPSKRPREQSRRNGKNVRARERVKGMLTFRCDWVFAHLNSHLLWWPIAICTASGPSAFYHGQKRGSRGLIHLKISTQLRTEGRRRDVFFSGVTIRHPRAYGQALTHPLVNNCDENDCLTHRRRHGSKWEMAGMVRGSQERLMGWIWANYICRDIKMS